MSRIVPALRNTIRALAIVVFVVFCWLEITGKPPGLLSKPPDLCAENHTLSLTLHASIAGDGKNSFYFNGQPNAPTLRLSPGDQLNITYVNDLPTKPAASCASPPCHDMTNLHFHGLAVPPSTPQDDVLNMMAMPGQSLHYSVQIPFDAPPGLYWYHTHPHGESARQDLDGMSGAIVVDGIDRYYPELRDMPERVLVLRDRVIDDGDDRKKIKEQLEIPGERCGTSTEQNLE